MSSRRAPLRRTTLNLLFDGLIFSVFLFTTAPQLTGLAIHEWLSLAFGAAIISHLLLHWSWIVQVARRFFGKLSWGARLNYLLNSLLFIAFTLIIVTGLLISEVALPFFGFSLVHDRLWLNIHHTASDAAVLLIGLHIALHWRWIVNTTRRLFSRRAQPAAELTPSTTPSEVQP
jgi:hypothetical protein